MQASYRRIYPIVISVFVAACANSMAQQNVMAPQDVAREFWSAMISTNIPKAKTFAKSDTRDHVNVGDDTEIEKINIQPSKRENGQTVVPTIMTGIKDGRQKTLSFNTVLVEEAGAWKVDFDKTTVSIHGVFNAE